MDTRAERRLGSAGHQVCGGECRARTIRFCARDC